MKVAINGAGIAASAPALSVMLPAASKRAEAQQAIQSAPTIAVTAERQSDRDRPMQDESPNAGRLLPN